MNIFGHTEDFFTNAEVYLTVAAKLAFKKTGIAFTVREARCDFNVDKKCLSVWFQQYTCGSNETVYFVQFFYDEIAGMRNEEELIDYFLSKRKEE